MKKIGYSFVLLMLLSCGVSQPSSHNRITVQFRDSVIRDYYLLSVRDSSIVIAPYTTEYVSTGSLIVSSEAVPFTKIEKIYERGQHTVGSILLPAFGAAALGGCAMCSVTGNGCHLGSDGGGTSHEETVRRERLQWYGVGGGFLLGAGMGLFTSYQDKEFTPESKHDMDRIRNLYAIYPMLEPIELKYVK